MKRHIHVVVVAFFSLGSCLGYGQEATARFPGSVLKWIHIAEGEFTKQHLDESKYVVQVWERQDSVTVALHNPGHEKHPSTKGDPGPLPEYEVEIDRRAGRVIRANYVR